MKVAIIGSGISSLGAAFLLHPHAEITVYEKNDYIGGHSRTIDVAGTPVDTGFIVFNKRNYPLLTGLFNHLGVPVAKSNMSFGVSIEDGWLEYGSQTLPSMMAQKRNLLRPKYLKMLKDILRFNREATHYLDADSDVTLGMVIEKMKLGNWFRDYYLLAMGASIWSCPEQAMLDFPAKTFIRFFENHGLLTVADQPQWYTVKGGSKEYISRLSRRFADSIKTSTGVVNVKRLKRSVKITDTTGNEASYDKVIFGCHADQALAMLDKPTEQEANILGSFRYQTNDIIVHKDASFMPQRKKAWSSWVYLQDQREKSDANVSLTYWMNNLQPLECKDDLFVTLNPTREPDENLIFDKHRFEHPIFDEKAVAAQDAVATIQGEQCWFAGAYQRYGFHEDGLLSAVKVAEHMGIGVPWR